MTVVTEFLLGYQFINTLNAFIGDSYFDLKFNEKQSKANIF